MVSLFGEHGCVGCEEEVDWVSAVESNSQDVISIHSSSDEDDEESLDEDEGDSTDEQDDASSQSSSDSSEADDPVAALLGFSVPDTSLWPRDDRVVPVSKRPKHEGDN